jgi:hypothetical protein
MMGLFSLRSGQIPMTRVKGIPDKRDLKPGMAHFPGTGPEGKTCGDCMHRGYKVQSQSASWDKKTKQSIYRWYKTYKCAMYRKLMQHNGPAVKSWYPACRHFQDKNP